MPGIVGLITQMPREWAEPQLQSMLRSLEHESFYASGTWVDESLGVYVGWVARRNSFSVDMPVANEKGDAVLIFSGEEYPEPGTADRLRQRGHRLSLSGPEYLVHLYEDDPSFPASLNGRFQGLVIDRMHNTATLFNDRFGMHRLYYHDSKQGFYFSPEAKAILAVRPELRESDARSMGEFVTCGCVLENRTLFRNLYVMPPASTWTFHNGLIRQKASYFQAKAWEQQDPLNAESYYRQLRDVFSRNLSRYSNGAEPVGMSLTGGLDSRMIMAWYKSTADLPCYTFGGPLGDCQDVKVAEQVARTCGHPHQVIRVGDEFLSRFSHYAARTVYLTDGCVDLTYSPDLYLNERAREIAPVRLTGNYGGEVLRQVVAFKPIDLTAGILSKEFMPHVEAARVTYEESRRCHPLSFAVFRQAPWHHYGLLSLEETQLSLRSPYLDNELVKTVYRAPRSATMDDRICLRLIEEGSKALRKMRTDRGPVNNGRSRQMTGSVQRSLLEFTFKAEYAYDYGMPQWVARLDHLLSPLRLERLFLGRHKFHHFRIWYKHSLAKYVQEMLLDRLTLSRPYLDPKMVQAIVRHHVRGDRNYTVEIHKLLTLELLHRLFLDFRNTSSVYSASA